MHWRKVRIGWLIVIARVLDTAAARYNHINRSNLTTLLVFPSPVFSFGPHLQTYRVIDRMLGNSMFSYTSHLCVQIDHGVCLCSDMISSKSQVKAIDDKLSYNIGLLWGLRLLEFSLLVMGPNSFNSGVYYDVGHASIEVPGFAFILLVHGRACIIILVCNIWR